MHTDTFKLGLRPVGFLTNAAGKRTHAIVPLVDTDEWDDLPTAEPDLLDRAFLARFNKDSGAFLTPAPVTNPIRAARQKAKITQSALAEAMGISAAALSKQEQEDHAPRPRTVDRALSKLAELRAKN